MNRILILFNSRRSSGVDANHSYSLLILFIWLLPLSIDAQTKWNVGFKYIIAFDSNRIANGKPRKIPVGVWYPTKNSGEGNTASKFVELAGYTWRSVETKTEALAAGYDHLKKFGSFFKADTSRMEEFYQSLSTGIYEAPLAVDRPPVILYFAGAREDAFENSFLFEKLAAIGIATIALPSNGKDSTGPVDRELIDNQFADYLYTFKNLSRILRCDTSRVITMGFSLGGLYACKLAALYPSIKGVVSIDGVNTSYYPFFKEQIEAWLAPIHVPYLQLSKRPFPGWDINPYFFDNLAKGKSWYLHFNCLDHRDFVSITHQFNSITDPASLKSLTGNGLEYIEAEKKYLVYKLTVDIVSKFLTGILNKNEFGKFNSFVNKQEIQSVLLEHSSKN